ncbi:MAG: hypothetical protein K0S47_3039 [Herbinix sp.]|jgi:hypothetical protein|nr:hypothetical protein [Herbinix sp.]
MQSCEFVTYITAIACALTKCYDEDELNLLAATFSQLGDTLATILAREALCDSKDDKNDAKAKNDSE